jgi:hypothetical protein
MSPAALDRRLSIASDLFATWRWLRQGRPVARGVETDGVNQEGD